MKLQGRNLSSGTQGADVALLHTDLRQLGLTIADAEATTQLFGASTHAVVQVFQKQHGLAPTGVVDSQTATTINAEVDKLARAHATAAGTASGVASAPPAAARPNPPPAPTAPAFGPAGPSGTPALTRPPENPPAATTPPVEVKVVYVPSPVQPPPSSTTPPTTPPPIPAPTFTVRGQVRQADGTVLTGASVQAFDQDLRSRQLLGTTVTDAAGKYLMRYNAEQFKLAEKGTADLVVQVYDATGKVLVSSPVVFNAPPDAVVDLMVSGSLYPGPSEYEQLAEVLKPLLPAGITFADLVEDETHQDISFLAGETGEGPQRIAFLAAANRLGLKTGLPAEAFYAFFRQKLPTDLAGLHGRGSGQLRSALQKSIQDNIVPLSLASKADEIIGRIIALPIDQPVFVVAPNLLYASPANLTGLPQDQSDYIAAKLNEQLSREILTKIGAMSPGMARVVHAALSRLDYRTVLDLTISAVITTRILAEARRDPSLTDEIARITTRLTNIGTATVAQVLRLDAPLQDHPAFLADVRRVTTLEYARLAQIDKTIASSLLEKLLPVWEAGDQPLADLVAQRSITQTQMADLRLTFELGRFTSNNIPLVTALRNKAIKSSVDLIGWEKSDWQQLIVAEKLQPPPGETVESYADTLAFNVEQTYPAHALIQRVLKPEKTGQFNVLDSLNAMLASNNRLIDGPNPAIINWGSLTAADQQKAQADLQNLAEFSNTYRELGVADLINDKSLELTRKKDAIAARVQLLNTFQKNNSDLDLRFVDFFARESNGLNWNDISTADQPSVRKQLMAYQRVIALADVTADRQMLLSKGFDSAYTIYSKTEDDFVTSSGLPLGNARKAYADAQERSLAVSHGAETIRSAARGGFRHIAKSNQPPELVNDLRQIDGFSDLFGSQNYCECNDCRSILSPAAYFADLMNFIEQNISKAAFVDAKLTQHPLYLKNRRPDLWTLPLTCENTSTLIPYLTIVDEVLERYLDNLHGPKSVNVYQLLNDPSNKISFGLPFCLPLEELRLYLSHFSITPYDVYSLLKQPDQKRWRAKLNLSSGEFTVITTADPANVLLRFGNLSAPYDVQDFIQAAGISREQLDDVLQQTFHSDLNNVLVDKKQSPDEIQNFPEILDNVTAARLDFIHRFIRLWKKTTWSIPDFDLILTSLTNAGLVGSDIDSKAVVTLAQSLELQQKLKLTAEELCALIDQMPVSHDFPKPPVKQTDRRLYERLFDLKGIFGEKVPNSPGGELNQSSGFHYYSLNVQNPLDQTADPKTPLLLAGLGISETELLLLFGLLQNEIPFSNTGDCTLDRKAISTLYRHGRLAKALNVSIDDFIQWLRLLFDPKGMVVKTLQQMDELRNFRDWLKVSRFNISGLRFILAGEESEAIKYTTDLAAVVTVVQAIQASAEFAQATPDVLAQLLKDALAKLLNLGASQVADLLAWISPDIKSDAIQNALKAAFTTDTPSQPKQPSDLDPLLALVHRMERVLAVIGNFKFSADSFKYLTQSAPALGIADLTNLRLGDLKALTLYKQLISVSEQAEPLVQALLDGYAGAKPDAFSPTDVTSMAKLWQQDESLLRSLNTALSSMPGLPAIAIQALDYMGQCLRMCQTLGVNGYSLQKLAKDAPFPNETKTEFDVLNEARDAALGAFSSKYDDEKVRQDKLEPYQDQINVKKRDALCDYIIALHQDLHFKDLRDIYGFFLLDVEMSGCFRTSRLVCANSSLQLYVQRCLANLEQSNPNLAPKIPVVQAVLKKEVKQQWEWRKNYRVWEANRKVFLWPQNYLDPDVRDDKTPIFNDLEDELLQEKITKEAAETAYQKYISQFAEVANLRITGSYRGQGDLLFQNKYYFFGRTQADPPQYYYRTWETDTDVWTHWQKIDLAINAERLSAVVSRGKLYVFWIDIKTTAVMQIQDGNQIPAGHSYTWSICYSCLNERGKWSPPQKLTLQEGPLIPDGQQSQSDFFSKSCFAEDADGEIYLLYYDFHYKEGSSGQYSDPVSNALVGPLDLYRNAFTPIASSQLPAQLANHATQIMIVGLMPVVFLGTTTGSIGEAEIDALAGLQGETIRSLNDIMTGPVVVATSGSNVPELFVVGSSHGDFVLTVADQQYLIQQQWHLGDFLGANRLVHLSTSVTEHLGEILFSSGLEAFLSLDTQCTSETPIGLTITNFQALLPPPDVLNSLDFKGAFGVYFRELFLHIPFLMFSQLNADQKFEEADWWISRIFDPTAIEQPQSKDSNWRYIEFRKPSLDTLKQMLNDKAALKVYKDDPFNPHAIARLRLNAYQEAAVLMNVRNHLDWGDALFAQDSMESLNEATMHYVLAADILGKRPAKVGKCDNPPDAALTYEQIGPLIGQGSEFLITLENWGQASVELPVSAVQQGAELASAGPAKSGNNAVSPLPGKGLGVSASATGRGEIMPHTRLSSYDYAAQDKINRSKSIDRWAGGQSVRYYPATDLTQHSLAFCVPFNDNLSQYWDRVEDRLFKIRHCMNISGVRRQLALFQPPIDPMLLVRAKAAGLSLDEILADLTVPLPPYRFNYLVEKAKQFTQTVQTFGSALLSALEKKDVEELTLLRTVHEQHILQATKAIKTQQVEEAQDQYAALLMTQAAAQNRFDYYKGLIDGGLTAFEGAEESLKNEATASKAEERDKRLAASIAYLVPQLGSPMSMNYGGREVGASLTAFADLAAGNSAIAEGRSGSAGLEAGFNRRAQEWAHQLESAQIELQQINNQLLAADIRQQIAQKELDLHQTNMDQADELYQFYRGKFTNLGLYTYLATTLNRLYREAYLLAYKMATLAQRAYQFERGDTTNFISPNNWQFDRAGLLAGEQLLLQLHRLESEYIKRNTRNMELTNSFPLSLLDPLTLITLRETGSCTFSIPEMMYDLFNPGMYNRIIKSVRLTVPCVTGPYTNFSAVLTLGANFVRQTASLDPAAISPRLQSPVSIAASTAHDSGVFELNFRDERYLPFEGAGAINSTWTLDLPSQVRAFDYDTISDVIIHISYEAKYDGNFKTTVEGAISDELTSFASTSGLFRLFSLRHDFSTAFYRLLNPTGTVQSTEFELTKQHFPYFLAAKNLSVSKLTVFLKPQGTEPVDTSGLNLVVNGLPAKTWSVFNQQTSLKQSDLSMSGSPFQNWTLNAGAGGLDKTALADILILVQYTATT